MALDIDETYPTFNDHFVYEDRTFKIQQIDPIYSGDTKYAVKCRARALMAGLLDIVPTFARRWRKR